MGRPKGSKNKKTLEREAMTIQETPKPKRTYTRRVTTNKDVMDQMTKSEERQALVAFAVVGVVLVVIGMAVGAMIW